MLMPFLTCFLSNVYINCVQLFNIAHTFTLIHWVKRLKEHQEVATSGFTFLHNWSVEMHFGLFTATSALSEVSTM